MSNRVLVTGGTGFLGVYIIQALVQRGIAVRAIRRSAQLPFFLPAATAAQVEWVSGDVLDVVSLQEAMQDVDAIVHAAAVVSFAAADYEQMHQVNVEGTANVVNMAVEQGVRRLVHISSVAALGRSPQNEQVDETRKWVDNKYNTQYARSKHRAEMEVWRGFAEGLEGVILNPSTILGLGNWHQSSCAIFKNAYTEFPWYTQGVNGFVGVADVAAVAAQLLLSDVHGKRFIVSAENLPFRQLFNLMADGFGNKRPHLHATPLLGAVAARVEAVKAFFTGNKPLLTSETARVAQSLTRFDNKALLQELPGFTYTPIAQVVKTATAQYLEALKLGTLTL